MGQSVEARGWLWLLVGTALLPVTIFQTVVPVAAWLAPVSLLRFVRTAARTAPALALILLAHTAAYMVALRNGFVPFGLPVMFAGALFYALVNSVPYWADRALGAPLDGLARTLVFPLTATTLDWLMSLVNPFATYGSPAYSQAAQPVLVQLVSVTGLWGLTFLVTWCAPVVNALWERGLASAAARRALVSFGAALLVVVLFGSGRLAFFAPASPTVRVAALTPDRAVWDVEAQRITWDRIGAASEAERAAFRARFAPYMDDLLARSRQEARAGARIVAWSEGAAFVLKEDVPELLRRAGELAHQEGIYLEMGLGVFRRTATPPFIENRAVLVDPSGRVVWEYDKSKPVPGESPMITAGPGVIPTVETPYGRLGTAICYDLDYPALLRQAGRAGVDLLLAPSNDFEAHKVTHSQIATFRAVENGFSLVRPASLGISLAADYQGRVLGSADYFLAPKAVMAANVPTQGAATVYARIGDLFAYLSAAGLVGLAVVGRLRRR